MDREAPSPCWKPGHAQPPRTPSLRLPSLVRLTRNLRLFVRAGIPLSSALATLSSQSGREPLSQLLALISADITEGHTLSASLRRRNAAFPPYYIELIRAGEESGSLEQILERLAAHLQQELELRREMLHASLYPAFICVASLSIGIAVLVFVIPTFEELFADYNAPLPWITQAVLMLSRWALPLLAGGILATGAALLAACHFTSRTSRRELALNMLQKIPLYGTFLSACSLSRLTGVLGTLLESGIPVATTLTLAAPAAGTRAMGEELCAFAQKVFEGSQLSSLFRSSRLFPDEVTHAVTLGEESGCLDEVLASLAELYQREARDSAAILHASVEPIFVATIGLIVGVLLLAVYLPIFDMGSVVGQ